MQCPECRFDNPPQMKFCGQCGTRLPTACPRCATPAVPGFKFCGECGAPLAAPVAPGTATAPAAAPPAPAAPPSSPRPQSEPPVLPGPRPAPPREGEIKQATVLVCELVFPGGEPPGPETLHTLLNRFLELAQTECQRYGGTLKPLLGHGFLAIFGAPLAYEDHPRRAVLAALGLADRLAAEAATVEAEHGVAWSGRMGIDTGAVVIGGIGEMAVGGTTELAQRLAQHAPTGVILASATTRRLIEEVAALTAVEPVPVPADGGTIEAWRVDGATPAEAGPSARRSASASPFVGRGRELAALAELRQLAAAGQGQVVGIAGEAGTGKSRLLLEFAHTLPEDEVLRLHGECLSYGSGIPYLPLAGMLRRAARLAENDPPAAAAAKLRGFLAGLGADPGDTLPFLLRLLGIGEGSEALDALEPQAVQTQTFAALRRVLLQASHQRLVMVESEDLHWIDDTSEEFLGSLVEVLAAARMLLVLTYRSGYQPRWLEKSYATQITVQHLSPGDSRQLVDALLRQSGGEPAVADAIVDKAEGNPFFLEELARSLAERAAGAEAAIPNTIQGVLMARIDRLPELHKRLLQTASVLGREFSRELLDALWEEPEPTTPLLAELQHWEFLHQLPATEEALYRFRHALTQEVVYQSLLTSRRRALHAAAAAALERLYAGRLEDVYDRLTYHYPKAGEPEKTVHYLTLFAERAARHWAHAEAAKALREALAQAERLPAEHRRRRRVEVLLRLAESLLPLARFPETLELFTRHEGELAEIGDPSLAARYRFWLAHTHTYLGQQEETRHHATQAIAAAQSCGDEATEGKACYVLGRHGFWSGQFAAGLEHSLRAVVLLERSGEPWWQGQAYWVAGFHHYALGQFDDALDALERARRIGEALDDPRLDSSWSIGHVYASLGCGEEGLEHCRRGLEAAKDPLNTAVAMGFLGHAHLEQGEIGEAVALLDDAVSRLEQTGMQQILGWFSAFLAEALLASGRLEPARHHAQAGLEISRDAAFGYGLGLAQRALGRIGAGSGEADGGRRHLEEALATFTALEVPFEAARTRLDLGRLAASEGDEAAAGHELAQARRAFEELEVTAYATRAGALAEELGVTPAGRV